MIISLSTMALSKLIEMKVVSLFILLMSTLLCGLLPFLIHKRIKNKGEGSKSKMALSAMMCLGGGVLLSVCFMHMIPEVQEGIYNAVQRGDMKDLPFSVATLSVCIGLFLVYLIEEIAFTLCKPKTEKEEDIELQPEKEKCLASPTKENGAVEDTKLQPEKDKSSECLTTENSGDGLDETSQPNDRKSAISSLRNFLLIVALAFHSIIEGLAIGLQNTTEEVWIMLGAVAIHKLVIVFCLSIELLETKTSQTLHLIYIIGFSFVSPVGIAIGIGIHEAMNQADNLDSPVMHILQGVAAGTLVYITFFEVLNKEREKPGNGLVKVILVIVGFVVMTIISSVLHD